MKTKDFKSVLNKPFYKRHMESTDIASPFDTAEEIFLLEYLIKEGFVIASYRNDNQEDSETYMISTMGHAFLEHYSRSRWFRYKAHLYYYNIIYGMLWASMIGSIAANILTEFYHFYITR